MSEEEMNDNLLMLKYFLKTECDENWEDYCNAINKALNLISNLQKENEELKETLKYTQDSWFNDTQKLDNLQKKLNKKDKVIDLILSEFAEIVKSCPADIYEDDYKIDCENQECNEKECFKQYFYEQVEKVGGEDE